VSVYIAFLSDIGVVARQSLRRLRLTVNGDSKSRYPSLSKAFKLWSLASDCTNLSTLDIYAEIDYFYMDQHAALRQYLSIDGWPISKSWPLVLRSIHALPNLKHLVLRPVFNSRWWYLDVIVNGRIVSASRTQLEDVKNVRFKVVRPLDEANRLSEQIKGYLRRGLRGKVGVRVIMLEGWDTYGAEVTIGLKGEMGEGIVSGEWSAVGQGGVSRMDGRLGIAMG
jgi:hypothetical protein